MTLTSLGDLAQGLALRRQSVEMQKQMARLTQELASGQAADPLRHLSGRLSPLAAITHDLRLAESHRSAAREVQIDSAAMQAALERVQTLTEPLGPTVLSLGSAPGQVGTFAVQARGILEDTISALNTSQAGRRLFAGTDIHTPPLASADTLLDALRGSLQGAATVTEAAARADDFFNAPDGGFATLIYQGATQPLSAVRLGSGEEVALDLRADDPDLRKVLHTLALTALADDPALTLDDPGRQALVHQAGTALMGAQQGLTALRSTLGATEARIDQSISRIGSEITSLRTARDDLLSVDPFETAVELEQVQSRLETIYTLTARNARLSLVNFL